jgi:hypothetical protein
MQACEIKASQLVGSYGYLSGDSPYEEFALEEGGDFHSWLHQRPEASGKWEYINCQIHIHFIHHGITEIVTPVSISKDRMTLKFNNSEEPAIFRRYE